MTYKSYRREFDSVPLIIHFIAATFQWSLWYDVLWIS